MYDLVRDDKHYLRGLKRKNISGLQAHKVNIAKSTLRKT